MNQNEIQVVYRGEEPWDKKGENLYCPECKNPMKKVNYEMLPQEIAEKLRDNDIDNFDAFQCPHKIEVLIWDDWGVDDDSYYEE